MPVYEYRCPSGHVTEAYRPVDLRSEAEPCKLCNAMAQKVILHAPRVFGDYDGYVSPVSGKWIEGRYARGEDFKRTQTRPYEGFDSELRAATAQTQAYEKACDSFIDESVERTAGELRAN